jgi:hypothetical protein
MYAGREQDMHFVCPDLENLVEIAELSPLKKDCKNRSKSIKSATERQTTDCYRGNFVFVFLNTVKLWQVHIGDKAVDCSLKHLRDRRPFAKNVFK